MPRRIWLIVLLGAVTAQAGHLLTYQVLFAAAAQQLQSSGAHAYFPALVKTALGAAALITLGALFLAGLARILRGRIQQGDSPSFLRLLAGLFTIQLSVFAFQESIEAVLSGGPAYSVDSLLLLGTLGQLPVAALAAFALRFFLVEVVPALSEAGSFVEPLWQPAGLAAAFAPIPIPHDEDSLRSRLATSSIRKRGPPFS
jgi:hypothetical protein